MRKTILALATAAAAALPISAAYADPPPWAPAHGYRGKHGSGRGYYGGYQPAYRYTDDGRGYWRGRDGRYYCRRSNGTVGLLVGGVAGALIGRSIDTRGDRAVGTILGAAGGALIGHEIDRNSSSCR